MWLLYVTELYYYYYLYNLCNSNLTWWHCIATVYQSAVKCVKSSTACELNCLYFVEKYMRFFYDMRHRQNMLRALQGINCSWYRKWQTNLRLWWHQRHENGLVLCVHNVGNRNLSIDFLFIHNSYYSLMDGNLHIYYSDIRFLVF